MIFISFFDAPGLKCHKKYSVHKPNQQFYGNQLISLLKLRMNCLQLGSEGWREVRGEGGGVMKLDSCMMIGQLLYSQCNSVSVCMMQSLLMMSRDKLQPVLWRLLGVTACSHLYTAFTFMHLAHTFIQRD